MQRNSALFKPQVEDLETNFILRKNLEGSKNRNTYQECIICGIKFFGGSAAKNCHLSGIKLHGCHRANLLAIIGRKSASRNNGREKGESINNKKPYDIQCGWFSHKFINKRFASKQNSKYSGSKLPRRL